MKNRMYTVLVAICAFTIVSDISAYWYTPVRRFVYRPYSVMPVSLEAVLGTCLAVGGAAVLLGYLCSESEAQKEARHKRERERLALIAAMTPAQREIYYQEERLKLEKQKADALQQQANAAWWNSVFNTVPVYYEPGYVVEEIVYY